MNSELELDIPVLCTWGSVFRLFFYKYFAALLLFIRSQFHFTHKI